MEPSCGDEWFDSLSGAVDMAMSEYKPGDIVPQFSPLYRVVHDPPGKGEQLRTFYRDERFPPCSECGKRFATYCSADFGKRKAKTFLIR